MELGNCFWLFCVQFSRIVGFEFESKNRKNKKKQKMENQDF